MDEEIEKLMQDVQTAVAKILVEDFELEPDAVHPGAHLVDDLGLDSLDAVDLMAALEDAFGARVDEERARAVRTVADIYRLVEESAAGAS